MGMPWVKVDTDILEDYRIGGLPDYLWRRLIELYLVAGRIDDGGALPLGECAWLLRISVDALECVFQELMRDGLVAGGPDGYYIPNFKEMQVPYSGQGRWNQTRSAIMDRDGWTCRYCGQRADHVDHVIPRCQGGTDDHENLVAACATCNLSKGGRTPEEAGMELR